MASASAVFKSLAKTNVSISNIALRMNNQVSESSYQGMFITAVIGKINLETGDMEYINHGHEPVMVVNKEKNYEYLESSFPPLGIMPVEDENFFETTKGHNWTIKSIWKGRWRKIMYKFIVFLY